MVNHSRCVCAIVLGGLISTVAVWNEPLSEARLRELAADAPAYVAPGSMYFQQ